MSIDDELRMREEQINDVREYLDELVSEYKAIEDKLME